MLKKSSDAKCTKMVGETKKTFYLLQCIHWSVPTFSLSGRNKVNFFFRDSYILFEINCCSSSRMHF